MYWAVFDCSCLLISWHKTGMLCQRLDLYDYDYCRRVDMCIDRDLFNLATHVLLFTWEVIQKKVCYIQNDSSGFRLAVGIRTSSLPCYAERPNTLKDNDVLSRLPMWANPITFGLWFPRKPQCFWSDNIMSEMNIYTRIVSLAVCEKSMMLRVKDRVFLSLWNW